MIERSLWKRATTLIVVGAIVTLGACRPKQGGSCSENPTSCESSTSRFVCVSGKYQQETCKGAKACTVANNVVNCDSSKGDPGDPCAAESTLVCGTDNHSKLRCEQGKLVFLSRCGGADGCSVDEKGAAYCSRPFAKDGDPCKEGGACSEDGTYDLSCKDGKMVRAHPCRGDEGCEPQSAGPVCDRSTGVVGDDCDMGNDETGFGCQANSNIMLICKAGKLVEGPLCQGEGKCGVARFGIDGRRHHKPLCDQSMANEGDACMVDLKPACSVDLKSKLFCQNGKFVLDKVCKKGCEVHSVPNPFECKDK